MNEFAPFVGILMRVFTYYNGFAPVAIFDTFRRIIFRVYPAHLSFELTSLVFLRVGRAFSHDAT